MIKGKFKAIVGVVALLSLFLWTGSTAAEGPDAANRNLSLSKGLAAKDTIYQILNINNIWTWLRHDGYSNHSPASKDGVYFPRGTKNAIYQDGFVWGGKTYLNSTYTTPSSQLVRVGGGTYNVGTQAGRITGSGATAVATPQTSPEIRIWRIRRDYTRMSDPELARDAAETNEISTNDVTGAQKQRVFDLYAADWANWPVALGAPYIERNGVSGYQKPPAFGPNFNVDSLISGKYDEPGVAGGDPNSAADQVVWTVFNDLNGVLTNAFTGSEPIGIEAQVTMWGYKRTDAMGNLYFKRIKFINKGGVDIGGGAKGSFWVDSMYVAQWSDPDLGAFGDDIAGCDSVSSMGFVYNGNANDTEFRKFNLPPPAIGYDFLAGPIIVGAPTDRAVFDLKYRMGWKNLPLTSFAYFSSGSGISDPPFTREGGLRWWKMLQGYVPDASAGPWVLYPSGTFTPSKFPLSGDPVRGTGFLDGKGTSWSFSPGDRRIVLNTGPFKMAPGDTQEVVMGVVGGMGSDRISSVAVMKFNDRFVQSTFDALFVVPKAPVSPKVTVAELDGQIVLDWGSDATAFGNTEIKRNDSYRFEGYNVYQFPAKTSGRADGKRLATYDITTNPTTVLDDQFDPASGQILSLPVHFGTNSGVKRFFMFNEDKILDIPRLNNEQEYYLAVTAYSIDTTLTLVPASLESEPIILTAVPHKLNPGVGITHKYGEMLPVKVKSGTTDVKLPVMVIDPTKTIDANWNIFFTVAGTPPVMSWNLKNMTSGQTVYTSTNLGSLLSGNLEDDAKFPTISGFRPEVAQVSAVIISDSSKWLTSPPPPEIGFTGARFSANAADHSSRWVTTAAALGQTYLGHFNSNYDHSKLRKVELRFGPTSGQKGYRTRRTGAGTEYLIQTGIVAGAAPAGEGFVNMPFSAWDVTETPHRQITLSWRDQDNNARWNPAVGADGLEIVFIHFQTYDPTGNQFRYPTATTNTGPAINNEVTFSDIMFGLSLTSNGTIISGDPGSVSNGTLYIRPSFTLNDAVVFEFDTKAPTYSADLAKADVSKISVFPNPYYAFNPAEISRFARFVTFTSLPQKATVKIFNVAGQLVRTLQKDSPDQFLRWDLNNSDNFPVASGMYIAHVDMPGLGATKVLKLAIIQEQEVLDVF